MNLQQIAQLGRLAAMEKVAAKLPFWSRKNFTQIMSQAGTRDPLGPGPRTQFLTNTVMDQFPETYGTSRGHFATNRNLPYFHGPAKRKAPKRVRVRPVGLKRPTRGRTRQPTPRNTNDPTNIKLPFSRPAVPTLTARPHRRLR